MRGVRQLDPSMHAILIAGIRIPRIVLYKSSSLSTSLYLLRPYFRAPTIEYMPLLNIKSMISPKPSYTLIVDIPLSVVLNRSAPHL